MKTSENIGIINQAYSLIKDEYVFQRSTSYLQKTFWDGVTEEDYIKLDIS